MTVTVLLFASWAEALQTERLELELRSAPTVGDALAAVGARLPAGRTLPKPLVAVNQEYAEAATVLAAGDEVAIIPPVAGG